MACCNNCSNTRNTSCGCGCNNNNTRSVSNSNTRSGSCNNCDFGGLGIFGRRFPLGGLTRFGFGCGCGRNNGCGCGCND